MHFFTASCVLDLTFLQDAAELPGYTLVHILGNLKTVPHQKLISPCHGEIFLYHKANVAVSGPTHPSCSVEVLQRKVI